MSIKTGEGKGNKKGKKSQSFFIYKITLYL